MKIRRLPVVFLLALQALAAVGQEEPPGNSAVPRPEPELTIAVPDSGTDLGVRLPEDPTPEDVPASEDARLLDDILPGGPDPGRPDPGRPDPGEAFVNANAAYEAGDHGRAVELYEALLRYGFENGHLHYNLGNAYLRHGELGRAIAAYRRGQVFLPRDEDLAANLAFARQSTKDAIEPPAPGAVLETLFFWHFGLSRGELGAVLVVVNLLLWSVLALRFYRRGSEVLRWTSFVLLLVVVALGASLAVHHLMPRETAIIVPQEIEVRSGTSLQDLVLFKLHAGTEVPVVDRREGALRIALPGEEGRGGWIAAEHAELVVQ